MTKDRRRRKRTAGGRQKRIWEGGRSGGVEIDGGGREGCREVEDDFNS